MVGGGGGKNGQKLLKKAYFGGRKCLKSTILIFFKNNFIFGLRRVNLAGIDTPHANFQKSKVFKKFPKRGTKNVIKILGTTPKKKPPTA